MTNPNMEQQRIERVFREIFEDDALQINDGTSADTLAEWDSFHQVRLVIGLQEEFGVTFSTDEALNLTSVAKMKQSLRAKGISAG